MERMQVYIHGCERMQWTYGVVDKRVQIYLHESELLRYLTECAQGVGGWVFLKCTLFSMPSTFLLDPKFTTN